ncbi:MAG TPA: dihydrodipicolinate synthase family protein, partial [Dehalococcoidia bacterium]|nr:dihydrodipicolinate synthase family protein [Dehalococcoidia bacterium]
FLGAESSLLPSFTPHKQELDEEGIRHDVRNSIQHGFFSVFAAGVGLRNQEERRRFVEIAVDEAAGRLLVSSGAGGGSSLEASIASLRQAESLGCSHVMFSLPADPNLTEDEVYEYARQAIDSTDLGVVLYIQSGDKFKRFHPGNVPLRVMGRLADLPNVVGAKITQVLDPVSTFECAQQLGNKLMLGPVNLELLPLMARICPIQFTAMWQVDACQSPEKPYVVDYLKLIAQDRLAEAVQLYWQFAPLVRLFWEEQAPILLRGGHPWVHLKYHQWCVGGNGGLFPEPEESRRDQFAPLSAADRARIRDTYRATGIIARQPDEEFVAGRVNYREGMDLPSSPQFSP